jgi:hypothetical protein
MDYRDGQCFSDLDDQRRHGAPSRAWRTPGKRGRGEQSAPYTHHVEMMAGFCIDQGGSRRRKQRVAAPHQGYFGRSRSHQFQSLGMKIKYISRSAQSSEDSGMMSCWSWCPIRMRQRHVRMVKPRASKEPKIRRCQHNRWVSSESFPGALHLGFRRRMKYLQATSRLGRRAGD